MGEQRTVNKGYQMANGEFIAIVNSDAPLRPGAVLACAAALMENSHALAVYPDYDVIGPDSEVIKSERLPHYDLYNSLLEFNVAMGPGLFIRRKTLELVGGRDPKYRFAGDLDFLFRVMQNGKFIHIPRVLATHRIHADAASFVGRGERLAKEQIWAIDKVFTNPNLPAEIKRLRFRIYSNAYNRVTWSCGRDIVAKANYQFQSVNYFVRFIFFNNKSLPFWKRLARSLIEIFKHIFTYLVSAIKSLLLPPIKQLLSFCVETIIKLTYPVFYVIFFSISNYSKVITKKKNNTPNKKAFALVSSYLPPQWSGGAVIIERVLGRLNPDLYCLISQNNYESVSNEYINRLPAKYHKIPDIRWMPSQNTISFIGKSIEYLQLHFYAMYRASFIARILQEEGCSVVIGTTGDLVGVLANYYAARLARIDLYLYYFDDYVTQWWADKSWENLAFRAEKFLVPNVKGFIVPNEFMRDELIKRHGETLINAYIVHNPSSASIEVSGNQVDNDANKKNEVQILFTGAIYHVNYDTFRILVQVIERLNDLPVRLHLYTAQPIETLEKEGIKGECVVFHRHVPPAEAGEVQKRADILLLPFTFHPDALDLVRTSATAKLSDYLVTGKPILAISPPDTYVDWYLKQYECGVVVNSENTVEIEYAILRIVQDKKLRERLMSNAHARAKIDFDILVSQEEFLAAIGIHSS